MITNKSITYYHRVMNLSTKLPSWQKIYFENVWLFGGKGSSINAGYENANDVNVRIPMQDIEDKRIFQVGDIIAVGKQGNIQKQSDLNGKEFYNVTSITINEYGNNPHVHLGGK